MAFIAGLGSSPRTTPSAPTASAIAADQEARTRPDVEDGLPGGRTEQAEHLGPLRDHVGSGVDALQAPGSLVVEPQHGHRAPRPSSDG